MYSTSNWEVFGREYRDPLYRHEPAILISIYMLADISLQIQTTTLTFMALLAAGITQSKSSRQTFNDKEEEPRRMKVFRNSINSSGQDLCEGC